MDQIIRLISCLNETLQSKVIKEILICKAKEEGKIEDLLRHKYIYFTPIELKEITSSLKVLEIYVRKLETIECPIYEAIFLEWLRKLDSDYNEEFKNKFEAVELSDKQLN